MLTVITIGVLTWRGHQFPTIVWVAGLVDVLVHAPESIQWWMQWWPK